MDELAPETSLSYQTLTDVLRWRSEPLSLSEPLSEDGDADLGDVVADANATSPFDHAAEALLADEINRLLAPLDDREAAILRLRFGLDRGEPRTLEEVGAALRFDPRADSSDRGQSHGQAPPPVIGHRRPRPADRLITFASGQPPSRSRAAPVVPHDSGAAVLHEGAQRGDQSHLLDGPGPAVQQAPPCRPDRRDSGRG